MTSQPFELRDGEKFTFLLISNVHTDFPGGFPVQLKDGTWVLNSYPTSPDLHWESMVGQIRFREIQEANLVLARTMKGEPFMITKQDNDAGEELAQLHTLLQLSGVAEYKTANLVIGSVEGGTPYIRRLSEIQKYHNTRGYSRTPVTLEKLEQAAHLASLVRSLSPSPGNFGRFGRGLFYLLSGLRQESGQERLHYFVRALEALILPDAGNTRRQFVHRCQLFAKAGPAAKDALGQIYDMRCDAEHVHDWDRSLRSSLGSEKAEDIALWRTRQVEALATFAYQRILTTPNLLQHFKDEISMSKFWKLLDDAKRKLWGGGLDLSTIPIVRKYDQWNRATR